MMVMLMFIYWIQFHSGHINDDDDDRDEEKTNMIQDYPF